MVQQNPVQAVFAFLALSLVACGPERVEVTEAATAVVAQPISSASSVLTHHNDLGRSGVFSSETALTPGNVLPATFGQRGYRNVSGQIYAQPLFVANVIIDGVSRNAVYVATMKNNVYAFDADGASPDPNAAVLRSRLPLAAPIQKTTNPDVAAGGNYMAGTDTIGIMSTPVIDPSSQVMYLVAGQQNGASWKWTLFALDIRTLDELNHVDIAGSFGGTAFDPFHHLQRAALTLVGGRVIVAFGGVADQSAYHGWVFSYPAAWSTWASSTPNVYATTTGAVRGGGIWHSGSGFASDGTSIYAMTGNSTTSPFTSPRPGCEAFIKLSPLLASPVSWQPSDAAQLDLADLDLGSGGPLVLPGSGNHVAGGGKTGVLFVHNQALTSRTWFQAADNLLSPPTEPRPCPASLPTPYDTGTPAPPNIHGNPVAWSNASFRRLYVWGEKDRLRGYDYDSVGNFGRPTCGAAAGVMAGVTANPGMPGGMLSISSNGSTASTGIVWATIPEPDKKRCDGPAPAGMWCDANQNLVKGRIYAFDATSLALLWDAPLPSFAKFAPPTIAGGRVFVPTFSDKLLIFGPQLSYVPTWTSLDGIAAPAARPAITSWNIANRMDVFIRAADDSLLHKAWNSGAWTPAGAWEGHGGILTSNPTATNFGTSQIDVLVGNTSHDLSDRRYASGWQPWAFVPGGGFITSDPVAVSWGTGRIDLFALGSDSQLKHLRFASGAWQPWEGSPFNGLTLKAGTRPAVVSWGSGRIDVVVRAQNDTLNHIFCTGNCAGADWSSWSNLGGILSSDPAVGSWGAGRLDVFVQGTDQQLKHIAYSGGAWSAWEAAPFDGLTLVTGGVPSVLAWAPFRLDVYARSYSVGDDGARNLLSHIAFDGTKWTWWESLANGIIVADPAALHAGNADQIVVVGLGNTTWATQRPSGVLP